jgi:hypothetical protein
VSSGGRRVTENADHHLPFWLRMLLLAWCSFVVTITIILLVKFTIPAIR